MYAFIAAALLLEVMDKELSTSGVWITFLLLGLVGFALSRLKRWAAVPSVAVIAILAWLHWQELHDPIVGPAILSEAGQTHYTQSNIATLVALALPLIGAIVPRSRRAA